MKYEESIKALESAKKGLEGTVNEVEKQANKQLDKMDEFNARIYEYEKAIKFLKLSQK